MKPTDQHREDELDEMLEETFPASDPPQLQSLAEDAAKAEARDGVASGPVERTFALGEQGSVTLHLAGEPLRVQIFLGPNGLSLDVEALDKLLSALKDTRAVLAGKG